MRELIVPFFAVVSFPVDCVLFLIELAFGNAQVGRQGGDEFDLPSDWLHQSDAEVSAYVSAQKQHGWLGAWD